MIEGALLGRAVGGLFRTSVTESNFFPLIGVAAFLGAGYRVPVAAVMFAAEATGLIAAIVVDLDGPRQQHVALDLGAVWPTAASALPQLTAGVAEGDSVISIPGEPTRVWYTTQYRSVRRRSVAEPALVPVDLDPSPGRPDALGQPGRSDLRKFVFTGP